MLTAFGLFWTGEGLGAQWPGGDLAIPALALVTALFALAMTALLRATRGAAAAVQ